MSSPASAPSYERRGSTLAVVPHCLHQRQNGYDPNFSSDEAYLNITNRSLRITLPQAASELRGAIQQETGLTCSAGVAPNHALQRSPTWAGTVTRRHDDCTIAITNEDLTPAQSHRRTSSHHEQPFRHHEYWNLLQGLSEHASHQGLPMQISATVTVNTSNLRITFEAVPTQLIQLNPSASGTIIPLAQDTNLHAPSSTHIQQAPSLLTVQKKKISRVYFRKRLMKATHDSNDRDQPNIFSQKRKTISKKRKCTPVSVKKLRHSKRQEQELDGHKPVSAAAAMGPVTRSRSKNKKGVSPATLSGKLLLADFNISLVQTQLLAKSGIFLYLSSCFINCYTI
ncbi:hypothetical protein EJB05_34735 [Eragrostis curvula]|uniref:UmuC domain-containing protein n=1 Tax=Eragrostis curvula TaxID=38414 RepID=A0A5J9U4W5_9POAL|nr:hypothetical protein EJB05_34723 [Eragrostis curvula]TVU18628.1 hypothetical protein EJB05_34735 [Eragrostis curvula]